MNTHAQEPDAAQRLALALIESGFGPFLGTPSGMHTPLHEALDRQAGVLTVAREDSAVGIAAGATLAGRTPAVLMPCSGLGRAVNAIASLVVPYQVPMLLVISLRGPGERHGGYPPLVEVSQGAAASDQCAGLTAVASGVDPDEDNLITKRLIRPVLDALSIDTVALDLDAPPVEAVRYVWDTVRNRRFPTALLVRPAISARQAA